MGQDRQGPTPMPPSADFHSMTNDQFITAARRYAHQPQTSGADLAFLLGAALARLSGATPASASDHADAATAPPRPSRY